MGKLREQWEQIRGNFKYEVVRTFVLWFFKIFGVSMIATFASAGAFIMGHREPATLIAIPSVFWIAQSVILYLKPKTIPPKSLEVVLSTHGDNSSDVYLEVKNHSEATTFSAQLRIISRNYGDGVKTFSYDGKWSHRYSIESWNEYSTEEDHGESISVSIAKGKSYRLRIATILEKEHGLCTLALVGIEEKLVWDFEPKHTSYLPFFVIGVSIFGEGFSEPVTGMYKLGPAHAYGPMQMVAV